ncbi:MAG: hypothetical protein ABSE99_01860 [Terracidiphilus sp.]
MTSPFSNLHLHLAQQIGSKSKKNRPREVGQVVSCDGANPSLAEFLIGFVRLLGEMRRDFLEEDRRVRINLPMPAGGNFGGFLKGFRLFRQL